MAENVGGIVWTAEMKTEQLVNAEKTTTNSLKKTERAFDNAGKASDRLDAKLTKTAKSVKTGMAGMGRSTGQVGIQIQQLVGQIQGGQNAFQAFGAQAADIGIVMGAPLIGVVAAFAAAIAGTLAPALFNGKTELEEFTEAIEKFKTGLSETDKLSKDTFSQLEIAKLNTEIYQVEQGIKKMEKSLVDLSKQAPSQTVTSQIIGTAAQISKAEDKLDSLTKKRDALFDVALNEKELKDVADITVANDKLSDSLTRQIIALEQGEKAAMEYAIAQQLQLKAGEQIPAAIQAQIDKVFDLKQAQKELAALENSRKKSEAFAQGVVNKGMSEEDRLTAEMDKLDQLHQQGLLDYQLYQDAKVAIAQQASEQLNAISEKETQAVISNQKAMTSAVLGFISSSTSAIMSGMDDQSGAYKALFALQQASSIASTILAAESAAMTALAPPPLGLGPVAGAGLSTTIRGLGYASAGIQAGLAIGGGRLNGGPVHPGMAHPVTEDGRPELLVQGGQQYLLPGSRGGEVISNKDMVKSGGQPNVNVNIVTPPGMTADVKSSSNDSGTDITATITAVADNIMNGGKVYTAMQKRTKLKSRTG